MNSVNKWKLVKLSMFISNSVYYVKNPPDKLTTIVSLFLSVSGFIYFYMYHTVVYLVM